MLIQSLTCSARRLYASCLNKNGSPTRGGVRVEDGRPIPVKKIKTKTKTKKNGKTKQKWEVLPVATNVLFPIKKHKIEKK